MIYVTDKATKKEIDSVKGKVYRKIKLVRTLEIDGIGINLYKIDESQGSSVRTLDSFGGGDNE